MRTAGSLCAGCEAVSGGWQKLRWQKELVQDKSLEEQGDERMEREQTLNQEAVSPQESRCQAESGASVKAKSVRHGALEPGGADTKRHKPQKRYQVRGPDAERLETNGRHILEGTRNKAQNTGVQGVRDTDAKPG